jgi:hypothetical protein
MDTPALDAVKLALVDSGGLRVVGGLGGVDQERHAAAACRRQLEDLPDLDGYPSQLSGLEYLGASTRCSGLHR